MTAVRVVGWEKGLQAVSLIAAVREYGELPLAEAKQLVEKLLAGSPVTVQFSDNVRRDAFRKIATTLGAKCE